MVKAATPHSRASKVLNYIKDRTPIPIKTLKRRLAMSKFDDLVDMLVEKEFVKLIIHDEEDCIEITGKGRHFLLFPEEHFLGQNTS